MAYCLLLIFRMTQETIMKKILIVDDEPLILYSLSKALQSDRVDVKAVPSGEDALSEINSCFYDLCFLDIYLPGISGLDVMKAIKELSPKTRVVIISSYDINDDVREEIEGNTYHFVAKPFDLYEIKRIVADELEKTAWSSRDSEFYEELFMKEKRQAIRRTPLIGTVGYSLSVLDLTELKIKKIDLRAEIIDISNGGVGIQTDYPIKHSQMVTFTHGVGHNAGIVMWSKTADDSRTYRAGVKFV